MGGKLVTTGREGADGNGAAGCGRARLSARGQAHVSTPDFGRILLIDDDRKLQFVLSANLRAEGYEVVTASNGREGLAEARRLSPDIIIMDEATSALDELTQARMMELVEDRLVDSTLLHVAHRPGLEKYHNRQIVLERKDEGPATISDKGSPGGLAGAFGRLFRRGTGQKTAA